MTVGERIAEAGEVAGRRWAEDVAALSELRRVRAIMRESFDGPVDVGQVRISGGRVWLETIVWVDEENIEPAGTVSLPSSVPKEFFELATKPAGDGVTYLSSSVHGFLRGATGVLDIVEDALGRGASGD